MRVVIGRIGRAHGIRGDVSVELRTDEPQRRFAVGSSVVCSGRELTIASSRQHQGRWLVRFEGVNDRTTAETLRNLLIETDVDPSEVPDDGYYDHQLIGLSVVVDGEPRATVSSVLHLPAHDLLVLDVDGTEVMVPFVAELVPDVDLAAGTVTIADRPGLLRPDEADEAR